MCKTAKSALYKNISPAKKRRSLNRLIKFQRTKLPVTENPPSPSIHSPEESPSTRKIFSTSIKRLAKSKVILTNYPACQVCDQDQCQYDDNHCLGFLLACVLSMNNTLDTMLENPLSNSLRKPPEENEKD